MRVPTGRKWIAFSLLAVVLPVSLLATLRLTGILPDPPTLETVTLETVSLNMSRPPNGPEETFPVHESVENSHRGGKMSVGIGVDVMHYYENFSRDPYWWRDGVNFMVNVTATAAEGRVESVSLRCYVLDADASVEISTVEALEEYNVKVTRTRYLGTNSSAAYVEAQALGSPCGLFTDVEWIFDDENSEDHALKATSEVLYYNGTTYQRMVVPIVLEMPISTSMEVES